MRIGSVQCQALLAELSSVAAASRRAIVYVGTTPVDASTLFLNPPKHHWSRFHDLSLAALWAAGEPPHAEEIWTVASKSRLELDT